MSILNLFLIFLSFLLKNALFWNFSFFEFQYLGQKVTDCPKNVTNMSNALNIHQTNVCDIGTKIDRKNPQFGTPYIPL
jgi:hypothetical protein